jgi:FkbM family methyltransferase
MSAGTDLPAAMKHPQGPTVTNLMGRTAHRIAQRFANLNVTYKVWSLRDRTQEDLVHVGTSYGGWTIPVSAVVPRGIALCVGAGEDISFDVELNKLGMFVFTLDPTPRAKRHVEQVLCGANGDTAVLIPDSPGEHYDLRRFQAARFRFLDVGMSDQDKTMRFWEPKNPEHVSHSIVNLQHTDRYFEARCVRFQTLCSTLKFESIQILKLDIEGAEYAVLEDLLAGSLRPTVICVEFDEGHTPQDGRYLDRITDQVMKLKRAGYALIRIDHWNSLFILRPEYRVGNPN